MRFAQKFPTDGPHAPIGTDAPKKLVEEINRRLEIVKEIRYEPRLINDDNQCSCEGSTLHFKFSFRINVYLSFYPESTANVSRYKHIYRMKAIDALKTLEDDIVRAAGGDETLRRAPGADLRVYLLNLRKAGCPLQGVPSKLLNEFVEAYTNARSDPIPDFGAEELSRYQALMGRIQAAIIYTAKPGGSPASNSETRAHHRRKGSSKGQTAKETKVSPTKVSSTKATFQTHLVSIEKEQEDPLTEASV